MGGRLLGVDQLEERALNLDITSLARKGLEAELSRLDAERAKVVALLADLGKGSAARESAPLRRTRKMSAEGRKRIQEAVRRRWERVRSAQAAGGPSSSAAEGTSSEDTTTAKAGTERPGRKLHAASKRSGNRKK